MARNQGPDTPDDAAFYRGNRDDDDAAAPRRSRSRVAEDETALAPLDERVVDLDSDEQSPFLRANKRVNVRRGALPRKTATRLRIVLVALVATTIVFTIALTLYRYGTHSWRFRVESTDAIEVTGVRHVVRGQIMRVMASDISRNIFFVPLELRKKQIEELPWVESATVMRILPNRLKVDIRERTPIAFVQLGSRIDLIDANGVVMAQPASTAGEKFSFPVITGSDESEALSTRAARMKIYQQLMRELDSNGAHYSQDVNDVDVSDPDDVKITVADSAGTVVIHLGASNFLDRYKIYVAHVQEWRQQFPHLSSVDLRYERQVILNPDLRGSASPAKPQPIASDPSAVPAARKQHR